MREAERWHVQSWRAVNAEREALEAWEQERGRVPAERVDASWREATAPGAGPRDARGAAEPLDPSAWRGELLARDPGGCLRRARLMARRAAALQAARRINPGATEAQITTPTQPGLLVQVLTSGPEGRMRMMTLHAGGEGVNVGANRVRLRPEDGGATPPP